MFDATKGKQVHADKADTASDEFASLLEDRPVRQQVTFLERANEVLLDDDKLDEFLTGSSNGTQPNAIGAGATPTPNDLQTALDVIMAAPGATTGQKAAMTRVFFGGPDHMQVEDDGTPVELKAARTERDNAKQAKQAAEDKLAEEQDENKSGSLAQQLKEAKAASATPADMVKKDEVKTLADEAMTAVNNVKGRGGIKPTGLDDAKSKIKAVVDKVS